jgi:hypothetical protein
VSFVPFLQFDPQAVRNSIDECEVRCDEGHIENARVAPAGLAKKVYVTFGGRRRLASESLGEFEHFPFRLRDRRISVVIDDSLDQEIVPGFFAETLRMVTDSIVASIGL